MMESDELKQDLKALKKEHNDKLDKIQEIRDAAKKEERSLTDEENTEKDKLFSELEDFEERMKNLDKEIEQALKLEKHETEKAQKAQRERRSNENNEGKIPGGLAEGKREDGETKDRDKILRLWSGKRALDILMGNCKMDGVEMELHQEAENEVRGFIGYQGLALPSWAVPVTKEYEQRAFETRTDIDQSNSAIQGTVVGPYVRALRENPIFSRIGANVIEGLTADYKIPAVTKQSLAWATAENSAAADGGSNFGKDTLAPVRLTGYADISERVIIQNGETAMAQVMADFGRETGNKIDAALLASSDVSNAPPSVAGTSGVLTFTETASFSDATSVMKDLVLAEQEVADDHGLEGNLAYVLSTKLLNQVKRSPLVSSVNPAMENFNYGFANVNGYPTYFSTVPTTATTSGDGLFGDWSKVYIGFFGGMDMMIDPYSVALNNQRRIVVHRHMDFSTIQGAAFVKFTSLFA